MITITVDYEGSRGLEEYHFTAFDKEYLDKLNEVESYKGKIDRVIIARGADSTRDFPGVFIPIGKEVLVNTTSVGVAMRKGRLLAERS